MTPKLNKIQ